MQIYSIDDKGEITVVYDSRWQFPELLGYEKGSKEYKALRKLWRERRWEYEKLSEGKRSEQVR